LDHLRAGSADDDTVASSPRSNNWLWLPVSRYLLDEIKAVSGGMAYLYCDILIEYLLLCMCMTVGLIMVRVLMQRHVPPWSPSFRDVRSALL